MQETENKQKDECEFYKNRNGQLEYNKLCEDCRYDCKQSFRTIIVECKIYPRVQGEGYGK